MFRLALQLLALTFLVFAGCGGGPSVSTLASRTQGHRVAVVSFAVDYYRAQMVGWERASRSGSMANRVYQMERHLERRLAEHWDVVPVARIVGRPAYRRLAGPEMNVVVPKVRGRRMPVMADTRRDVSSCALTPERAAALGEVTGANILALAYSEWTVETAQFSSSTKPVARTRLSLYDTAGKRLYSGRRDLMNDNVVGSWGHVTYESNKIRHWVSAYTAGIDSLVPAP